MHSPGSNKTFIKNISNQPVLDSPLIHMMTFHLQIQWLLPRSGKKSYIYTKHHLSSICDCKPTSVLIFKKNKHWSERKPWNNGSVLFKMTLRTTIPRLEVQDFVFWTPGWKRIATWKNLANFFKFNSCVPSRGRTLHEHSFFMFRDFRLLLQGILKIASATNLVWL